MLGNASERRIQRLVRCNALLNEAATRQKKQK